MKDCDFLENGIVQRKGFLHKGKNMPIIEEMSVQGLFKGQKAIGSVTSVNIISKKFGWYGNYKNGYCNFDFNDLKTHRRQYL